MKRSLVWSGVLFVAILIGALSAWAQSTTTVGPGDTQNVNPSQGKPAPATQKQLDNALTPETRQTLQQAMEAMDPSTNNSAATTMELGPNEGAVIDGHQVTRIEYARLPARLRAALTAAPQ